MLNGINISGLSEFVHEIRDDKEQANAEYGVRLTWESGTTSKVETKAMVLGKCKVIREFTMGMDEPTQLLGRNTAPNPQEYLFAGLAGCMSVVFTIGASLLGIQLEKFILEVDGALDLQGFLDDESDVDAGLSEINYTIRVKGSGTEAQYLQLIEKIKKHSPNFNTIANPVKLNANLIIED